MAQDHITILKAVLEKNGKLNENSSCEMLYFKGKNEGKEILNAIGYCIRIAKEDAEGQAEQDDNGNKRPYFGESKI